MNCLVRIYECHSPRKVFSVITESVIQALCAVISCNRIMIAKKSSTSYPLEVLMFLEHYLNFLLKKYDGLNHLSISEQEIDQLAIGFSNYLYLSIEFKLTRDL